MNNGYFLTFWLYIWANIIKNSAVYKIIRGVYDFMSRKWRSSGIADLFRKRFFSEDTAANSVFGKIMFSPFTFLEKIRKKYNESLNFAKEHSIAVRSCKYYLHNFMAVNTRFIGIFLMSCAVVAGLGNFIKGGKIVLYVAVLVFGAILAAFNVNAVDFVENSLISKLISACLGIDLKYNFYYVTKCGGTHRFYCAVLFGAVTGAIATLISPVYGAAFAIGLLFLFMVLYKTEFGVFMTVFLAPIVPTMVVVGLSLLCLFSLVIRALTAKKFEWRLEGMGLLVLSMIVIYLFSALISYARMNCLTIWIVYFAFMAFYFVVINTMKSKKQIMSLLTVFALSGLLVCIYGIMQYVFGWNITQAWTDEEMFSDIKMRIYSTLENPNVLGEYILLVLPVSIALMWTKKNFLAKLCYGGISLVMFAALILTYSRGCWIGIMIAAAVFVTLVAGKLWGLALPLIPIVPMVIPESIIKRFTSIGDMGDSSTSYRVYIWLGTLLMLGDFWLEGIGPGPAAFTQIYPFYSYNAVVTPHSHNLFLQIITESGVLGICTFIGVLLFFMKRLAVSASKSGKGSEAHTMLVTIGAAMLGFLVQGMFDNSFYNYRVFMIFWYVIAIGTALAYAAEGELKGEEAKEE